MVFKTIGFLATLLAVARAGLLSNTGAVAVGPVGATPILRAENYDPHPQYSFSYSVADGLTGDNKAQEEHRSGDVVHGRYSLIEPDGSRRVVSYAADPITGFNAVVQREPSVTVTKAVATAPVAAAVHPGPAVVAAAGPAAAVAVRPQAIVGAPLIHGVNTPYLAGNVLAGHGLGLGLGLGIRPGGIYGPYGTQAIVAGAAYGAGGIVKVH